MENNTVLSIAHHEPKDNRAAWITPAIADHNIEEVTRNQTGLASDGAGSPYS